MTTVEELTTVQSLNAPQCDTIHDVLAVRALEPHEKAWQFVEEQERQRLGPAHTTDVPPPEDVQGATFLDDAEAPVAGEQAAGTRARVPKRREGGAKAKVPRKRDHRGDRAGCEEDDSLLLFRRSQKALRKEARHVNMKEVLCRSLSGITDATNDVSNPLSSPTGLRSSSTWSPLLATSITNRFLSNVQQQKKQAFERLLQKEMTNSQLSISRLTTENGEPDDCLPELVIGDETANMEPPNTEEDVFLVNIPASFSQTDTPPVENTTSQNLVELDDAEERAQSEALMRKHELWRLRQRHLRAKRSAEESVSQAKLRDNTQTLRTQSLMQVAAATTTSSAASITTTTTLTTTTTTTQAMSTMPAADVDGLAEGLMLSQRGIMHRSQSITLGLSADHIDMIRRVNNFDNVSNQRVVVFESKSSKQSKESSSSTKQGTV